MQIIPCRSYFCRSHVAAKENRERFTRAPVRAMPEIIASFSFLQFQIARTSADNKRRGSTRILHAPSCKHRQLNVTIVHSFFVARARAPFYQEVRISARQEVVMDTCGSSTAPRVTSEEEERGAEVGLDPRKWTRGHHLSESFRRWKSTFPRDYRDFGSGPNFTSSSMRKPWEKPALTPFSIEKTPFSLRWDSMKLFLFNGEKVLLVHGSGRIN